MKRAIITRAESPNDCISVSVEKCAKNKPHQACLYQFIVLQGVTKATREVVSDRSNEF